MFRCRLEGSTPSPCDPLAQVDVGRDALHRAIFGRADDGVGAWAEVGVDVLIVSEWAPGELQAIVDAGNATLPAEVYEQWFSALPQERQSEVTELWGRPRGRSWFTRTRAENSW